MNEALDKIPVIDPKDQDRDTTETIRRTDEHAVTEMRGLRKSDAIPVTSTMKPQDESAPLFSSTDAQELRSRWDAVQTGFVDEPRKAVEQADTLVETVINRLSRIFADERTMLEGQWESGDNVSTEDLRLALQRYRSFFTRLLSV